MVETFLSGFAKGYIGERERRLEREAEKEDTLFKYKMQNLTEQRELRTKKKQQEQEWMHNAKLAADQLGDPEAVSTFYNEFKGGNTLNQVQQRIADGYYVKNDKYKAPDQIIKVKGETVKVPKAVTMTYDDETRSPEYEKVNARIDEIDPTLRSEQIVQDDELTSVAEGNTSSKYIFKDTSKLKMGDFADVQLKYSQALASGDQKAIDEAKQMLDAQKDAIIFKAQAEAEAKGEIQQLYGILDENGYLEDVIPGMVNDQGQLINTRGLKPTPVEVPNPNMIVKIDKDTNKRRFDVAGKLSTRGADYEKASNKYVSATQNQMAIEEHLNKYPGIGKNVNDLAVLAVDLEGEAKAAVELLDTQRGKTLEAFQSGDAAAIAQETSNFEKMMNDLKNFENPENSLLAPGIHEIAIARARYSSLIDNAVFQFAAANGISGRDMSDADVKRFKDMITKGGEKAILQNLDAINGIVLTNLMAAEEGLSSDGELAQVTKDLGVKGIKDITPLRLGDKLNKISPALRRKHDQIRAELKRGQANAALGAQGKFPQEEPEGGIVEVTTQAERDKLPSGTQYRGPDGKLRIKK